MENMKSFVFFFLVLIKMKSVGYRRRSCFVYLTFQNKIKNKKKEL